MKKILFFVIALSLLSGCAVNKSVYIPYNDKSHKDASYEWAPHDDGGEWWYLTGYASGPENKLYLYQFTIFHAHLIRNPVNVLELYPLHLSFTDCATGQHIFHEDLKFSSGDVYADTKCAVSEGSRICLDNRQIKIEGASDRLKMNLEGIPAKEATWHGKDGVIVMGHPDRPNERSYYYSFTNIRTKGDIEFKDEKGNWTKIDGTGKAWFDRQWGRFTEVGWEWFSFRFFDDEEIMLFPFPKTGSKEGSYIDRKGNVTTFDNYTYRVKKFATFNGKKIPLGWTVSVPFKEKEYEVIPLVDDQFNPSKLNNYWEGICKVQNGKGELVGYAVIETPGSAY